MPSNKPAPRHAASGRAILTVLLTSLLSFPAWADPAMEWVQRMSDAKKPIWDDEVDQLLLNARLRDELEPFLDESIRLIDWL